MNQPKQPENPPADTDGTNPSGTTPNGVPDNAGEQEPKGWPSSDRHQTETEPHR